MAERPNILILITHDSGRHFGCYGAGVRTPHIDRMAGEGVRFEQNFCTAPQCSPARASLLTSRMPVENGMIGLAHRGFRLKPDVPRLPALFAAGGYSTHLIGLQHEGPDARELGYEDVPKVASKCIPDVLPVALDFIRSAPRQPFYACIGVGETHRPYQRGYDADDPAEVKVPPYLPDLPEVRQDIAELNGCIRAVDRAIGEISTALERTGLRENTLFLYTTDHGIAFPRAKATLFDPGVSTALVMRGPGLPQGLVVERLTSHLDLMPTLLEIAGLPPAEGMEGCSLLPLLDNPSAPWRDSLFLEMTYHAAYDPMRAIRTERYKYIRSYELDMFMVPPNVDNGYSKEVFMARGEHRKPRPPEMLFDLVEDPAETNNLAGRPEARDVLTDLRKRVDRWLTDRNDPVLRGAVPVPEGAVVTPRENINPNDTQRH